MIQQLYPYDLYYGFEDDDFEGQGMGYDDNYFRIISSMLRINKRRIQSTVDIIWHLPR